MDLNPKFKIWDIIADAAIRDLYPKWHPDETRLKPIPPTDDAWYNNYTPHDRQPSSKPLGKTVW